MRVSAIRILLFVVPVANVLAQTPTLQMGTVYECPAVQAECFMGGGQVLLYKTGTSDLWDEPIYINKDGTLQTSDGAIKRMGD